MSTLNSGEREGLEVRRMAAQQAMQIRHSMAAQQAMRIMNIAWQHSRPCEVEHSEREHLSDLSCLKRKIRAMAFPMVAESAGSPAARQHLNPKP